VLLIVDKEQDVESGHKAIGGSIGYSDACSQRLDGVGFNRWMEVGPVFGAIEACWRRFGTDFLIGATASYMAMQVHVENA
jgi:hypothetical protein